MATSICTVLLALAFTAQAVQPELSSPRCSNLQIAAWLKSSGRTDTAPSCLRRDIAELLTAKPSAVAEVLIRWDKKVDWLSAARVQKVAMYGQTLSLLTDFPLDPQSTLAYSLQSHRVPQNGLILDVGAHVGMVTILLSKMNPGAHVVSFEPASLNRFLLEVNLALNGVGYTSGVEGEGLRGLQPGTVEVRGEAIAGKEGTERFGFAPREPDRSALVRRAGLFSPGVVPVKTLSIEAVMDQLDVAKIDFLKLDCEGCEIDAFKSYRSDDQLPELGYVTGELHDTTDQHPVRQIKKVRELFCTNKAAMHTTSGAPLCQ